MKLIEITKLENIVVPLVSHNKADAIAELVNVLAKNGEITDAADVLKAVMEREATRTTGIGQGLAIPHGKSAATSNLLLAIGKTNEAIDFQSIDKKPVTLICLLVSPPDKANPHITALAQISRLMSDDKFKIGLNSAKTAKEIHDLIARFSEGT